MTNNQANPFLYNITPINVLESRLKFSDKIILSDIITVFNENMPYYKSNKFLAKKFKASANTISNVFSRLIKDSWIKAGINKLGYREVTAINVKKIFGETVTKNLKSSFMDHKRFAKWIRISFSNMKDKLAKGNLPSQKLGGVYLNNYKQPSQNLGTPSQKLGKASQNLGESSQKMLTSNISSNIKSKSISNKKLHVRSSKSKSKNSNKYHDDSLASINVYSNSCLNSTGLNKAGAQAHLARRDSSKHSIKLPSSKFQEIREAMHNAFPKLKTSQFYERICISSWLNGKKANNTPKFSVSEIKTAIEKAKKYDQNHLVRNPFRLVYNILQTTRQEQMNAKAGQKKYQNKESKSNNSKNKNTSSKSSSSSSSSSDSDNSDDLEAAETLKVLNDHSEEDADAKAKGFKPNSFAYSSYQNVMGSFKASFPYFVSSKKGYHEIDNWLRENIKNSNDEGSLISDVALRSMMNLTSINTPTTAKDPVKYIDQQYKKAKAKN